MSDPFSTLLFADHSFVEGAASVLDFGNALTQYNVSMTGEQADALALRADWRAVQADIHSAIAEFLVDLSKERGEKTET